MATGKNSGYRWWWLFPVTGLFALVWYVVRVIPRPSRASYPCQRVAAPMAGGFLLWLAGVTGAAAALGRARGFLGRSRNGWTVIAVLFLLSAGLLVLVSLPDAPLHAVLTQETNTPVGAAIGIHPGRVAWVYDPDAVDWEGYASSDHWWESRHTDPATVEQMVSRAIRGIAGETTDAAAWDAIFRYNNRSRGRGDVGYAPGEKITIKANLVTSIARSGFVDTDTYEKDASVLNNIDTSPQVLLVLLRRLVHTVGAAQQDIHVGDPTALVPNHYWDILHGEFPDVKYWDNYGGSGRTRAEFSTVPFYWSTTAADGKVPDYLPRAVAEADYIINAAVLKGHSCGMSLCSKNHFGTLIRCPDGHLRDTGMADYYNTHLSLPNSAWSPGTAHYRAQVDLMGHPDIGAKTVLYLLDGLYSGYYWDAVPVKWNSAPFNGDWPSSLLASLDPVAIDSVGYDFLRAEWPGIIADGAGDGLQGGADDYLHEAAQAGSPPSGTFYDPDRDGIPMTSLGVHEHWNNPSAKQYSRNLGTGAGIELFSISNPGGVPGEISLNRERLNFGGVHGGPTPPPQTFSIVHTGGGTAAWIVSGGASWLECTPTSGCDAARLTVSVNPAGLNAGTYTGALTITDLNADRTALELTVVFKIFASGVDAAPFGRFATPEDRSTVASSIPVTGWVLDDTAVDSVKLYREEGAGLVYIGDAMLVEGARPDVETAYPDYPCNYKAGWGYMMLTNFLPGGGNGTFTLHAVARDSSGHAVTLGTKTITCDNAHAVKPFGAIDSPGPGEEVSGGDYRNQGWALTPMPNSIPTDGSTLAVYVDGVFQGRPVYDIYRPDVADLFPGYANSDGASAYFDIDTTTLENGVHTIAWSAADGAGNEDGIGSRYFAVQNTQGAHGRAGVRGKGSGVREEEQSVWRRVKDGGSGSVPVTVLRGFNQQAQPVSVDPAKDGTVSIKIKPMERIVLHLTPTTQHSTPKNAPSGRTSGYLKLGNRLQSLPIGSTLDRDRGVFYWQPGPGFAGSYHFVFITRDEQGTHRQNITVGIL